ncbi:MAG: glycosyltransferase [Acidobacteriota bacterium]
MFDLETWTVRGEKLTVLITCRELVFRAGSQLYSRDVAEVLRGHGHAPVVYSPRLGEVASDLRRRGVPVIDDLARLGETPDVIHGQHHFEAMTAMLRFPLTPAIFVCHGWLPWQEAPPSFPTVCRYVAVDSLRRDRLVLEHGIPPAKVTVLPNFVDLTRFRPRSPLPPRPARALLFSNQVSGRDPVSQAVREAAETNGLTLDIRGQGSGRPVAAPESLLPEYDLVFARGRAALEAMAVGAAVVLCDIEGSGALVRPDNFDALRDANFGLLTLRSPVSAEGLSRELASYDPADAARVSERARRELGRETVLERLVAIYRSAIAEGSSWPAAHEADCLAAASRYVAWASKQIDGRAIETLEDLAAARADAAFAVGRAAEFRVALDALERSPFSRLRARLLGMGGVVSAYRRLKGLPES